MMNQGAVQVPQEKHCLGRKLREAVILEELLQCYYLYNLTANLKEGALRKRKCLVGFSSGTKESARHSSSDNPSEMYQADSHTEGSHGSWLLACTSCTPLLCTICCVYSSQPPFIAIPPCIYFLDRCAVVLYCVMLCCIFCVSTLRAT